MNWFLCQVSYVWLCSDFPTSAHWRRVSAGAKLVKRAKFARQIRGQILPPLRNCFLLIGPLLPKCRSALKKSNFDAWIRQQSMTENELIELWAEKLPENFLKKGRLSFRKQKPSGNPRRKSRFSRSQKYHRRNRFWFSKLTKMKKNENILS